VSRTARVQQTARFLGDRIYHAHGADAARRAELLRGRAADDYSYVEWLYDYHPSGGGQ
jgi:hypothetical protein